MATKGSDCWYNSNFHEVIYSPNIGSQYSKKAYSIKLATKKRMKITLKRYRNLKIIFFSPNVKEKEGFNSRLRKGSALMGFFGLV
jgi:hypothetical protein